MDINLRAWLTANLGTNKTTTTLLLVLLVVVMVILLWWLTKKILHYVIPRLTAKTKTVWDDIIFNDRILNSLSTLIPVILLDQLLPILFKDSTSFLPIVLAGTDVLIIMDSVWILVSIFNSVNEILSQDERHKDKPIGSLTQLAKILTFSVGAILIISTMIGRSPLFLLSGLGAMAAILLLVFKDSILGFVASIQLSANNMVQVGDWVTVPNYGADGDVLEINLTTIKVQNFDLTITTIPTYAFISDSFTNWRGMSNSNGRRIKRAIYLKIDSIGFCDDDMLERLGKIALVTDYIQHRKEEIKAYNDSHKVDKSTLVNGRNMTNVGVFKAYIEAYLKANPNINDEMMVMVRQLPPSEKGLPLEIYAFSKDKNWKAYENIMSDIFDHVLSAVPYFDLVVFENPAGSDFRRVVG